MNPNDSAPGGRPWFPLENKAPCCVPEAQLVAENLSLHYGKAPAFRGVTLTVNKRCITALVGPSGCGKSSFLMSLNRLTDLIPGCHVSGSVRLGSEEILGAKVDVVGLRRRIGMIFQKPSPFPFSIVKNLTVPLWEHRVRDRDTVEALVEQALTDVGLWAEVKDRLSAPAQSLSGGQQQRLCLARALVLKPEVLLLDEPCSALDPLASGVVEDLIASFRGRYTVLVVTHNLAQARRIADDVAVFWVRDGAGQLIESGSVQQIFEAPQEELTRSYMTGLRG